MGKSPVPIISALAPPHRALTKDEALKVRVVYDKHTSSQKLLAEWLPQRFQDRGHHRDVSSYQPMVIQALVRKAVPTQPGGDHASFHSKIRERKSESHMPPGAE
jgi:hypothetical protein